MHLVWTDDKVRERSQNKLKRYIRIGQKTFSINKDIMIGTLPICLKYNVCNHCIIPAKIYECEMWKLTRSLQNKQKSMERAMLRITLTDKKESHMDQRTNDVEITHNLEEGTVK